MKSLAQFLYEAYANHTNWKSLATGSDLPQYGDLKQEIKDAWEAVAREADSHLSHDPVTA